MSEKRFICGMGFPINSDDPIRIITDKETNKDYFKFSDICGIMNEQQATIEQLQRKCFELENNIIRQNTELWERCVRFTKLEKENGELKEENSNLNSILNEVGLQKPFIKILDDYMIEYDGSCFSMHKPSDIRSFVYLMNRNNNFDELQCEYNDESMVIDDE